MLSSTTESRFVACVTHVRAQKRLCTLVSSLLVLNWCLFVCVHCDFRIRFNVESGPSLRITCELTSPTGEVLIREDNVDEAQEVFTIETGGLHTLCFKSGAGGHVVDFDLVISHRPHLAADSLPSTADVDQLLDDVNMLQRQLRAVAQDQRTIRARMNGHREMSETTNGSVVWWSTLEFGVVILCSVAQVIYVRRLFEEKRNNAM